MHQIKLNDHEKLAECLTHSTDDPLVVTRFVEKFKELFPDQISKPFNELEKAANYKLDEWADEFHAEQLQKEEQAEARMLMESKDRRVA